MYKFTTWLQAAPKKAGVNVFSIAYGVPQCQEEDFNFFRYKIRFELNLKFDIIVKTIGSTFAERMYL